MVGLYFYDRHVVELTEGLRPSGRGELEITDLNRAYLERDALRVEMLGRGIAWLDTGTHHSLLQASNYIEAIEERQGQMVACIEEIAWSQGWIDDDALRRLAEPLAKNDYGRALLRLLEDERGPAA